MTKKNNQLSCQKIISGGQTGVDRGALDACLEKGFNFGGWCPKGRIAEDGIINKKYGLRETDETEYIFRTHKNIDESDGTLIIGHPELSKGTLATKNYALKTNKPVLIFADSFDSKNKINETINWLKNNNVEVLNIAGPRQSEWTDAYRTAFKITSILIDQINNSSQ